ncbi:DNA topoisomerase (ATP-hydrolyzing) [Lentilactobacillus senioris DSM 24302 = JCM 17472]|uniref:DNA topoisomerase 4 subunit A n=1 Tax=Lentilactobacillus senioris DSM 24302 = JCM 17472 TaxID=1423802 RepID=A0A0R2CR98_9LACO|nr:DNA topoisomerase (ATP-hydrolyzing) [Lentilactobacillus senioris DSM 24302 = JCM 17472]
MTSKLSKIENLTLEDVMGDRFARYSKSIIQERALPDIRDGLKPVQRRILYAMNKDGNTYDKGFRKSAKSVGNVMGNFHPHGDSSIYEALVRMSQDWKVREPLIEMHGNNGSMDGDPPAAMRYTEARLSKIAGEMLRDIDQETVDWVLNFDDTEYEPTVLPARFPNLLVNGSTGISAGYATDIPPHNLGEVIDAILYLQKHPDASTDKLMEFVAGPDFPTGGIVQGLDGIRQAYETGHGRVVVRSKTEIKSIRGNKSQIVITEIPYEVNKAQLVKRIDEIRINKKIDGIAEVRDESDRDGLTIVVELKRDVDSNGILNYLFKNTDLQVSYTFNMVAINHMRPERVSLKTMLISYLEFQQELIKKRTIYDLKKAQDRQHIVQGLIKALSILDQVIKTIRASKNRKDARDNLVKAYEFSTVQADAIVALQLYRLTNTDVTQLEKEAADLAARIEADQLILIDDNELNRILAKELKQISKQFRQPRMTEIQAKVADLKISKTVTVPDEDVIVLVSQQGYLKRSSIRSYTASNGEENGLQDFDHPVFLAKVNTRDHLLMFTNKGNLIYRPVFEISDVRWKDTGEHLSQTVGLESDEMVIATYSFKSLKETGEFLIATDDGYIKRVAFESLTPGRTYKKHAFVYEKLKTPTAKVINVTYLPQPTDDMSVMLISHLGYALRFDLAEIPVNGARTTGVKSMNLSSDWVTNVQIVSEDQSVGLITQRGAFKKMKVSEVAPTSRARKGVLVLRELKNDPHRVVDFTVINQLDAPLVVYTDHSKEHDLLPNEFSNGGRYSNGSFVIDVNAEGQPISIQPKLLELIIN